MGLRRRVVAFERVGGTLVWDSGDLVAGTVEGSERANLITHQLLTFAGGRLFYNTNLGSIVCLDPLTGRVDWLVQYSRRSSAGQQKRADRFRYRDRTPCVVAKGLVYCAPQDCPEIFALDASTGDLVWASDDNRVSDAVHILGVSGDSLIVSGDRIIWLDRLTGRLRGRFPAATTPGPVNALPHPRGLGRGIISAGEVYWPTAGEIFVFPADLDGRARGGVDNPPIRRRIALGARGSEGVNMVAAADWLLLASPSRLMAFQQPPAAAAGQSPTE